jgi:hypothetical protein
MTNEESASSSGDTFQERVKDIITSWLAPEFTLSDIPPGDEVRWAIQANDGSRHVIICSLKRAGDHVLLEGRVSFSTVHQASVAAMAPEERHQWLYGLRLALTAMGLDFGFSEPFASVSVQQHAYVDGGLSKDTFLQRLHTIRHGIAYIQYYVQQRFDG